MGSVNVQEQLFDEVNAGSELSGIAPEHRPLTLPLRRAGAELRSPDVSEVEHAQTSFGMPQSSRISCLLQSPLFRGLSTSECAGIASQAREARYERHDQIFGEGDAVESVSILASGRAQIAQRSRSGTQFILRLKKRGEVLGGLGVESGATHFLTAQALESCCVLTWDRCKFEVLEERYPTLRQNTVRLFADYLRVLEERFLELASEQVGCRLARLLVRLVDQGHRSDQGRSRVDFSREELAQMTGSTLFTVSRLLSKWEDRGIVQCQRKSVVVMNRRGLLELTGNDCG